MVNKFLLDSECNPQNFQMKVLMWSNNDPNTYIYIYIIRANTNPKIETMCIQVEI